MKKLVIMAAGTGGHIFPGLAIAQTMKARGWEVTWLGTTHGMEKEIVPAHGLEMDSITFAGMRGRGIGHMLRGGLQLVGSFFKCFGILGRRKPDVVLGMGGYVTVPGGFMARLRGIPLVTVNADSDILLSNKILAKSAKKILCGFDVNWGELQEKVVVTGNPIRKEIAAVLPPEERFAGRVGPLRILAVGGSLGARALNEALPRALAVIPVDQRPMIVHQSGKAHIEVLKKAYAKKGVEAELRDFIDDMAGQYAEADLVICRAGAITVSELTAAGVASVLVPLVVSSTSHQRENARWMFRHHAAIHMEQSELDAVHLSELLLSITREKCLELASAARKIGRPEANESIANALEQAAKKAV